MNTTFKCTYTQCGSVIVFNFNLSKHRNICQYKQGRELNLIRAYFSFSLRTLVATINQSQWKKFLLQDTMDLDGALVYARISDDEEVEELPSFTDKDVDIWYTSDTIVWVKKELLQFLFKKLLTLLLVSNFKTNNYITKFLFLSEYKSIIENDVHNKFLMSQSESSICII